MTIRYVRSPTALWRRTPGSVVLLAAGGTEPVTLGGPGAQLWELLEKPLALSEAVETFSPNEAGAGLVVHDQVAALLSDLEQRRLIVSVENR